MRSAISEYTSYAAPHIASPRAGDSRLTLVTGTRSHAAPHPARLTPRQREVLALLCEGLPNKLICRRLNISPGTVKAHISSIFRELGVGSRLQAVVAARARGLLDAHADTAEAEYAEADR